ncbi:MAG: hemolysin III family protein [Clostridia bacterium]|nr:hemolysin III family protein [Clostridia bacterium]
MKKLYEYTFGEELANTVTHGVMAILVLFSMPFAILYVNARGSLIDAIGVSIFMISIFLMLLSSTLFHSMEKDSEQKRIFKIFDHIFIYVAIAGSYTAVALTVIGGWQGIVITCIQWTMVIAGILQKVLLNRKNPKSSVGVYLIMGWTLLAFFPLFIKQATFGIFLFILLGGIFYSVGAIIYAKKAFKYYHMVWHIFVNLGALMHFIGLVFFLE